MATVINNPPGDSSGNDSPLGWVVAVIVILLIVVLFFVYGLPLIRQASQGQSGTNINVQLPNPTQGQNQGSNTGSQTP